MTLKLQQLLDVAEKEVNDSGPNNPTLVKIIDEIEKFSIQDQDNVEGEPSQDHVDITIDLSVLEIISEHISFQNMGTKPVREEKTSIGSLGLKQTLSELVHNIWEKEDDSMKDGAINCLSGTENVVLLHVESPESFYVMRTKDRQLADKQ